MLALILSAFLFINLLSLILIALVAVGMAVRSPKRRHLWRFMVVPTLAVLLIFEYAVLVGVPPPLRQSGHSGERSARPCHGVLFLQLHTCKRHPEVETASALHCAARLPYGMQAHLHLSQKLLG